MFKEKVLLVDDDLSILETISQIFLQEEIDILTAESGEKCLELFEKGFQGIVLMDISMPGMNGWDTIQSIVDRGQANQSVFIMQTAGASQKNESDELAGYITDYLEKPYTPDEIINAVKKYL